MIEPQISEGMKHFIETGKDKEKNPHTEAFQAARDANLERAVQHYQAALEGEPVQTEAMKRLGQIAYADGQRSEARRWFEAYLETQPDVAESRFVQRLLQRIEAP